MRAYFTLATTMLLAGSIMMFGAAVSAQEAGVQSLTVYAGASVFPDPDFDSVALVEFPFSLSRNQFEFFRPVEEDGYLYARVFAQVDLLDTYGGIVDSASTYFSVRVASRTEAMQKGIRLFNKLMLLVEPGVYSARVTVIDAVSKRTGDAFVDRIVVHHPITDRVQIAGPVLAYVISRADSGVASTDRLVRNGFKIIANPVSVYSYSDTMVYLYGELYNLAAGSAPVRVDFEVHREGSLFRTLGGRELSRPGTSIAFAESFDIKGWPTGQYELHTATEDVESGQRDSSRVTFTIVSPEEVLAAYEEETSNDPYLRLNPREREDLVAYVLTPQEKETLKRLSPEATVNFLDRFWEEHKMSVPSGAAVQPAPRVTRDELIRRFHYANAHYSSNETKTNGWASDRGRIFMQYGAWDERIDRQTPRKSNPFEIWFYRTIKEGKVFVFVDWTGGHDYRLVHSNVYGEVFDREWDRIISSGLLYMEPDEVVDPDPAGP